MINMDLLAKLLCTLLEIILCQVSLKRWLLLYNSEVAQYVLLFTPLILIFEKALFSKVVINKSIDYFFAIYVVVCFV